MIDLKGRRLILDCDEVLLGWYDGFRPAVRDEVFRLNGHWIDSPAPSSYDMSEWLGGMAQPEIDALISRFNSCPASGFGSLRPLPGAVEAIDALHAAGVRMSVITKAGSHPETRRMRPVNLLEVFGDVFDEVILLPLDVSKFEAFSRYEPAIVIDDHIANVVDAQRAGHEAWLMHSQHNHLDREADLSAGVKVLGSWSAFNAREILPEGSVAEPA